MSDVRNDPNPDDFHRISGDTDASLKFLIRFGAEAPSSHNTQPWMFRVRGTIIEVRVNRDRTLPLSDPSGRELFVSIGCAIENIAIAADYFGMSCRTDLCPDPADPMLAARITFTGMAPSKTGRDHLIFHISKRHANREPFEARKIPEDVLRELSALTEGNCSADFVTEEWRKKEIVKIVGEATSYAFHDKGFCKELSEWIRPSLPKGGDGMPGYNLGMPLPVSFIVPLAIRHANVEPSQRKMVDKMLNASPAFLVVSSDDGPRNWISCGRLLERIWLTASRLGVNMGILAAAIEMDGYHEELRKAAGSGRRPQAFARIGYSKKVPKRSPRLATGEVMAKN